MGCICWIDKPQDWKIKFKGNNKNVDNDIVYNMIIGEFDDEITAGEITMWISKVNYDKIMSNEYAVTKSPYSARPIRIFDKSQNEIEPVVGIEMDKVLGL